MRKLASILLLAAISLRAQGHENVLVVVNDSSAVSRSIGEYYALRRRIPLQNICHINVTPEETISRAQYDEMALRIRAYLDNRRLLDKILYIVTTSGVPLRVSGRVAMDGDVASVDSELTLLYQGGAHPLNGSLRNPFFGKKDAAFGHPAFPFI